jgi:LAO/AO transport system ATPase
LTDPAGTAVDPPAPAGRRGRRDTDVGVLVRGARDGDPRSVARLISLVEDGSPLLREVAAALAPHTGRARVLGVTGPPGVGKSTTTTALVRALRVGGRRVGVLAVDPSSPFSGGALLGDRVRMAHHAGDPGVFIRSMAARGHLGGLAWATPQALRVLDAAGCDVVVVETVGVGQSELEVAALADTTLVLLAPGAGDGIQAAKAGIMEIADLFVVNKADRDGADRTVRELRSMLAMGDRRPGAWQPPVLRTVATSDTGIDDVLAGVESHRVWLESSGEGWRRRVTRAAREVEALALAGLRERLGEAGRPATMARLAEQVAAGETDPYRAADELAGQL